MNERKTQERLMKYVLKSKGLKRDNVTSLIESDYSNYLEDLYFKYVNSRGQVHYLRPKYTIRDIKVKNVYFAMS